MIIRTGDDPFGAYPCRALRGFGVGDRRVAPVPGPPAPAASCEVFPPDGFPPCSRRRPDAPGLRVDARGLGLGAVRGARVPPCERRGARGADGPGLWRRSCGARTVGTADAPPPPPRPRRLPAPSACLLSTRGPKRPTLCRARARPAD
ncbi:hypothetical protein SUDANB6_03869 [Streptomyces sp. enrichment culture]